MAKTNSEKAEKTKNSESYKKAKSKAEEYAKDPEKLNDLVDKASNKAAGKKESLDAIRTQLMACFRLIKAYSKGTYRDSLVFVSYAGGISRVFRHAN